MPENFTIATMDFGGTTSDLNIISDGRIIYPDGKFHFQVNPHDLESIVKDIVDNFSLMINEAKDEGYKVNALSFAFPGPSDYPKGIVGKLNNVPAFQKAGQFPLGDRLSSALNLPVFMNNDADLYSLGELIHGIVPQIQKDTAWEIQSCAGLTIGSGLGGGFASKKDGMFLGTTSTGMEIGGSAVNYIGQDVRLEFCLSRRGLVRFYNEAANYGAIKFDIEEPDAPKIISLYDRLKNEQDPRTQAARKAFSKLGEYTGRAIQLANNLFDPHIVVIAGGVANAYDQFVPRAIDWLTSPLSEVDRITPIYKKVYDLTDAQQRKMFSEEEVFGGKKFGISKSKLGTAKATYLGAYEFAKSKLNK